MNEKDKIRAAIQFHRDAQKAADKANFDLREAEKICDKAVIDLVRVIKASGKDEIIFEEKCYMIHWTTDDQPNSIVISEFTGLIL